MRPECVQICVLKHAYHIVESIEIDKPTIILSIWSIFIQMVATCVRVHMCEWAGALNSVQMCVLLKYVESLE